MHRLALGLLCAATLPAADNVIVLKAARLFDGRSDRVVTPGLVVVTNKRITAVGQNAVAPAGAETIDLGDATLLPGFMDAHTHLTSPFERDYRVSELDALKKPVSERTLDAV